MAVPTRQLELTERATAGLSVDPRDRREQLRVVAAQLYGRGLDRTQIVQALAPHLTMESMQENPYHRESLKYVRAKLRGWERDPEFRDLIYQQAVGALDLDIPAILQGVSSKAKRGRVDAARLALEVTGRHNPKGEQTPTNITINIANIPRPD